MRFNPFFHIIFFFIYLESDAQNLDLIFFSFHNFRFSHLQHTPFIYTIKVMNNKNMQTRGTVRIFLAPKFDERGREFKFGEMRLLMMEMDRFEVNLHPGENVIRRKSTESTVTIPYEQTFRNIDKERPDGDQQQAGGRLEMFSKEGYAYDFCGTLLLKFWHSVFCFEYFFLRNRLRMASTHATASRRSRIG